MTCLDRNGVLIHIGDYVKIVTGIQIYEVTNITNIINTTYNQCHLYNPGGPTLILVSSQVIKVDMSNPEDIRQLSPL